MKGVILLGSVALLAPFLGGCGDDESGFRVEQTPSKAEIDRKIQTVKESSSIPVGAKPNILAGLAKQRETAR